MNNREDQETTTSLGKCVVCNAPAEHKCAGCQNVSYCNRDHQRQAWKTHKAVCKPLFSIQSDNVLGRHLIATRKIRAGEVILQEPPLILGPPQQTAPLCLGDCFKVLRPPFVHPCEKCGWPLCGAGKCSHSQLHEPECFYTRERGQKITVSNYVFPHPNYQCLTVLRILYQRDHNKKLWNKLMQLESHCTDRKGTDKYENDRVSVAQFLHRFFKLEKVFSEEEIMKVCGILQVNGHEVPLTEPPYVAIYEKTSMFEHNCRPNCCKSFASNGDVLISAAQDIEAGAHLSITYTDSLWGTANRRHYLYETKYFACSCDRCSDPTEFGTYFSALKCNQNSCKGYVLPATFLVDPGKESTEPWRCLECGYTMSSSAVETILERIGRDLEAMQKGDPHSCQLFLDYYQRLLHPNHYYLTDVRIAFAQLIGQESSDGLISCSDDDIEKKLLLCKKLIDLLKILNSAEVRVQGTLLFEMHAAVAEIARRRATAGATAPSEVQGMLMHSKDLLKQAVNLLKHEPEELPEGKICTQAKKNLQNIEDVLRTLHINLGDSIL